MTGITDFVVTGTMPHAAIDKYAPLVPAELAVLWTDHGIGTFRDGYLRVINPDDWTQLVSDTHEGFRPRIPILTSAMGGIIGWDGELSSGHPTPRLAIASVSQALASASAMDRSWLLAGLRRWRTCGYSTCTPTLRS